MRLVIEAMNWTCETHRLSEEMVHYCINVHRISDGARLVISDGAGKESTFVLVSSEGQWLAQRDGEVHETSNIAPVSVFFGLPKGDKLDRVVRQLSELGIAQLILVRMSRNVVVLDGARLDKRIERLRRVATEAARQSQRSRILDIVGPIDFSDALELSKGFTHALFCEPSASDPMPAMQADHRCGIFVGPEGGFSPAECEQMSANGVLAVQLGRTVLRTETAALVAATTALSRLNFL
jgi:16S rRNA (uracil1498-N3)-methyltransferase